MTSKAFRSACRSSGGGSMTSACSEWRKRSSRRAVRKGRGRARLLDDADKVDSEHGHARPCAGDPRSYRRAEGKAWMAGTSPAMTVFVARQHNKEGSTDGL